MALIIEAPNEIYSLENQQNTKLFLAGGITNCPDWQSVAIKKLRHIKCLTIYNPRRKKFNTNNNSQTEVQIVWEYNHLKDADIILFWFSRGSFNPIVLYELGKWGNSRIKKLFIGVDDEYERKIDVYIQTKLANPNIIIYNNLDDICNNISTHLLLRRL